MPKRLPRIAISERVFMSPIPGRSRRRRQRSSPSFASVQTRAASPPYLASIAAQSLHALRHRAGVPVDRRPLTKRRLELPGIHAGDRRGVERARMALDLERPGERLLDGHLLVEDEADEQGKRVARQKGVRLVVVREVEPVGLRHRRHGSDRTECRGTNACTLREWTRSPSSARRRAWFERTFDDPTPAQAQGWPAIATGEHTLIQAPTGSGKTLAAFLYGLDSIPARARACACCTCRR